MSLIGDELAVISLGVTCQTASRINSEVRLIRELTGDRSLEVSSMPWDWLVSPVMTTVEMLRDLHAFPPLEELTIRGAGSGKPWWRRMNCYYWHAFDLAGGGPDLVDTNYEVVKAKFASMADKAAALKDGRRIVCVVSNTQPNIEEVVQAVGTFSSFIGHAELTGLRDQVQATFGPATELTLITHPELHSGATVEGVRVVERARDSSYYWTGSAQPWRDVLFEMFT